jgi:hypothetical protein
MDAKYVIGATGKVAIFSQYLGLEHRDVAALMDAFTGDGSLSGAGFCSMVGDQLITFGRSTSTGIAAKPEDAKMLTQLLHDNALTLVFYSPKLGWVATNSVDDFEHDRTKPCTPDTLMASRIFR